MKVNFFYLIFLWTIGALFKPVLAEDVKSVDVPWDTVMAKIQMIESLTQPDSIKSILMKNLFKDYQLTEQDYGTFYENFTNLPPQLQLKFLNRVKAILQEFVKRHYIPPGYKTFTEGDRKTE